MCCNKKVFFNENCELENRCDYIMIDKGWVDKVLALKNYKANFYVKILGTPSRGFDMHKL